MTKPLGYYVSPPKSSPYYGRIQSIESKLGSFLQQLNKTELYNLMAYCSCLCAGDESSEMALAYLDEITSEFKFLNRSILFSFIPFIHSVIQERGNAN
jgi:hypothetical protein